MNSLFYVVSKVLYTYTQYSVKKVSCTLYEVSYPLSVLFEVHPVPARERDGVDGAAGDRGADGARRRPHAHAQRQPFSGGSERGDRALAGGIQFVRTATAASQILPVKNLLLFRIFGLPVYSRVFGVLY